MNTRRCLSLAVVAVVAGLTVSGRADAPAGRYTITNGTVYDTKTKLTWQQTVPSTEYAWAAAKTYCSGLDMAGTGWRLPTVKELQTIVDESRKSADESMESEAIDTTAFPSTPRFFFWSSSPLAGSSSSVWSVNFRVGAIDLLDVSYPGYVRCVR